MKKPRTAQTEGACVGGSSPIGCRGLRVYGVELAAHSSAARRLVAVARIEIGWVKRIGLAVTAGLAARRRAVVVGLDMGVGLLKWVLVDYLRTLGTPLCL